MLRARSERGGKEVESCSLDNNDEDIKTIGYSTIDSLFRNIKVDNDGIEDEWTLSRRCPNNLEGDDHNAINDKSVFEEVKTLDSDVPTTLDYKEFDSCYLIECIYLLQSMINSPNAIKKQSFY